MNCIFHFKLNNSKWVNLLPKLNKNSSEANNIQNQHSELKNYS